MFEVNIVCLAFAQDDRLLRQVKIFVEQELSVRFFFLRQVICFQALSLYIVLIYSVNKSQHSVQLI